MIIQSPPLDFYQATIDGPLVTSACTDVRPKMKVLFDYVRPYETAKDMYENYINGHGKRSTRVKRVLKRRLRLTKKRLDIFRKANGYEPDATC